MKSPSLKPRSKKRSLEHSKSIMSETLPLRLRLVRAYTSWVRIQRRDERGCRACWDGTGKQSLGSVSKFEKRGCKLTVVVSTLHLLGAEQKCEIFKKGVLYVSYFLPFVFSNSNAKMGTETSLSTLSCVIPLHPPSLKALSNSYSRPPPFLPKRPHHPPNLPPHVCFRVGK